MQAAIDIGSNTVRLLIGEVSGGRVKVHSQTLAATRLGDTRVGAALSPAGRAKTLAALEHFKELLAEAGVEQPPVVAATSAVREAADGLDFQREVAQRLGWQLQILTGEQEAACSFRGAAAELGAGAMAQTAVIDVGGGSTELICQQPDGRIVGRSVKVGAVRLFNGEVPPQQLKPLLAGLLPVLPPLAGQRQFVSVGGTMTTVAALLARLRVYDRQAVSGRLIKEEELAALEEELAPLTPEQRLQRYPLLQGREQVIVAGLAIYLALAELLPAAGFVASDAGLLDGLLLQAAEQGYTD